MTRQEALELLGQHVRSERMIGHSLASEAVMRAPARGLGRDEEEWGLAGPRPVTAPPAGASERDS